jgi:Transposase DDE domain
MAEPITEDQLRGLKFFKRLSPLLDRLHEVGTERDHAGNRRLFFDQYCKLVLLYLFNPLIGSVRMLQESLQLNNAARAAGVKRFSLASFSEAPAVFDPEALKQVIAELAGEIRPFASDPRLKDLQHLITLADGTILAALPKLASTIYNQGRDGKPMHGWRLHTHLVLGSPAPELIERTSAKGAASSERRHLREHLQAGRCYVLDRGFQAAKLLNDIHAAQSRYVCRVRENLSPQVLEERNLSAEATAAGVIGDALVSMTRRWGGTASDHPMRLITVAGTAHPKRTRKGTKQSDGTIFLLTNLLEEPPELIALIYRYRWTIELFFRFLKQILGCRHLLSQRPEGIDIQIYCAVIAAMLIHLQTGKKPNKAIVFVLGMYLAGIASEEEVVARLNRPDNTGVKLAAKAALWKKLGVD